MGLLAPPKVMKTPRGADSQSAAPRLVSASGRTSPGGVFNGVGMGLWLTKVDEDSPWRGLSVCCAETRLGVGPEIARTRLQRSW
jgi:hypothetical protein